jgi:hypothetical protein
MSKDQENWRLLFCVATAFLVLVIIFAWMHNGRASYPPLL